jgi:hypothetical protein
LAKYTSAQTTEWVAEQLRKAEGVLKVEVLDDQVLRVSREKYEPFIAGIVSKTCVDREAVKPLVKSEHDVEIIANVPKESYWTGSALGLAEDNNIATGAFSELYRAIDVENVRTVQQKERAFLERGLRQHTGVSGFERVYDRVYRVSRHGKPDLLVAMLNEYELTSDHLRTARERFGKFDAAVITNPNGKATHSAEEAATQMGIEVLKWGPFLGRLNKK